MAKILYVEDDSNLRPAIAVELSDHSLTICADGFQALEEILKSYRANNHDRFAHPFDLMIFDGVLPNIDGFTLTRIVRMIEKLGMVKPAKIAITSAYGNMIEEKMINEAGADFYWQKPEKLLTMRKTIDEMFGNE